MDGFETPEEAAMDGFPAKYCRVVASRNDCRNAYVLLDTGCDGRSYFYGVNCSQQDGRWFGVSSGNGGGWALSDAARDLGTWSLWDEAPSGADRVEVECAGEQSVYPIHQGAYLAVWFDQPSSVTPRVTAFRVNGVWVPQPDWQVLFFGSDE